MSERKVINKYYPPDFDPAKIPRRSKTQQKQIKVRNMLSMTIRCDTCSTYIYRGTKVNSRKEEVHGETYLGIQIFRFYIKCKNCAAEILMNTDPRNSGYVVEAGARRNYEPEVDEEEEQPVGDAMEIRRLASKREMDTLSALDELKSMKARRARVSADSILEGMNKGSAPTLQLEEDKDKDKDKDEDKQQLDIFQRLRSMHVRVSVDNSMLEDLQPLQKQRVDKFERSRHDDEELFKKRKPTYHYLSVPKKSSVPKTQATSNGLALLCQHYDSIDEEAS